MAAQIYILPFLSDNQLIVKNVVNLAPGAPFPINSLELISVPVAGGNNNQKIVTELNNFGINIELSKIMFCPAAAVVLAATGVLVPPGSLFALCRTTQNPNATGSIFILGTTSNMNLIQDSRQILNGGTNNLLNELVICLGTTPHPTPPAPTPSPKKFRLIRFLPPFFFPPPFIGQPFLSPYAPYGNSVIRTPVGSPFFRLPGLSLPPDFVPAVIPTVRQPMLSPFGNPFPTRVREPSPVYKNLFEEKSRPAHFRSPRFKMDGGYYSKYLKYKNKYLELKNQLENQV